MIGVMERGVFECDGVRAVFGGWMSDVVEGGEEEGASDAR